MAYTLVAVDVKGIQHYLYGSNRLKENIGASELVAQATEAWIYESVHSMRHNFDFHGNFDSQAGNWFTDATIESGKLDVEVIYAGGGNAVLIFANSEKAKDFTRTLTKMAISRASGLEISIAHQPFEWSEPLSEAYQKLMVEVLPRRKSAYQPSLPLLGLGVTAACQSTGLPAVAVDPYEPERIISAETEAKLARRDEAEKRFQRLLGLNRDRRLRMISDFNELGNKHEASYMAVVHADGNNIGWRFQKISKKYSTADENRDLINRLRRFSQSLRKSAGQALKEAFDIFLNRIDWHQEKLVYQNIEVDIRKENGDYIIPIRPLIVGGDDTTFVCDGRLGLTLAALYLQAFHKHQLDDGLNLEPHACAGVAIVHNHYPFARAYELSEALCTSAKEYARTKANKMVSAIDWHFGVSGVLDPLPVIRQREYTVPAGKLYLRPLWLTTPEHDPLHSWQTFRDITIAFQKDWADKRNKLKALREVLRDRPLSTQQFLSAHGLSGKLPFIRGVDNTSFAKYGWSTETGGDCGYFDAIEAVDLFVDLEE